jgi:hypothetical protein
MKNIIRSAWLATLLALVPFTLNATENAAVIDAVNAALMAGTGHGNIINSLTAEPFNMSLEDATVAAMEAGSASNSEAFAAAGVAAAANLPEAESVAIAVKGAGADAAAVDLAMQEYVKLMDQPFIHHDGTIPTGGGLTRPPAVSPAS